MLKSKGQDCKSFIELEPDYYYYHIHYEDSEGKHHKLTTDHKDMIEWIIRAFPNKAFEGMKEVT